MFKSLFSSVVICLYSLSCANAVSEFEYKIIDVVNYYTAAVMAAKMCEKYKFDDAAAEERFLSNHQLARIYAIRVFMMNRPGDSPAELEEAASSMDRQMAADFPKFYAKGGCDNKILSDFLWRFEGYKRLPKIAYPPRNLSDSSFNNAARDWLKANHLD